MLKTATVPEPFAPVFEKAEEHVSSLFANMKREPENGRVLIGNERYVLLRCESFYLAWFTALAETFGEEMAEEFIYNTAREIGRSDSRAFAVKLNVADPVERLASGPVHFAFAGWARVEILGDSTPATDDSYFLHYYHPNTFESEVLGQQGKKMNRCACIFSAGYSAGWCSEAFGVEVHGREINCVAAGHSHCEFIMAPSTKLDEHEQRLAG